ncbi:MAG: cupin domain-containing protein [Actinomycetes bacterium]
MTTADEDGRFHRRLSHVSASSLSGPTDQTPGMHRVEALSGRTVGSRQLWMGQTHVAPASSTGDHHHGESETGIYVLSGHPEFVFLDGGRETRLRTSPGDYVYVPPWVPHREENPDPEAEAVVVISRTTQEAIVVDLPDLGGAGSGG